MATDPLNADRFPMNAVILESVLNQALIMKQLAPPEGATMDCTRKARTGALKLMNLVNLDKATFH